MRHEDVTAILGAALLALLASLGCGSDAVAPAGDNLVTGQWNGAHVSLSLDDRGGATEYDCAHGGLSAPLVLDRDGRFRVAGVHVLEHGGPEREGEVPDSIRAVYWGRAAGGALSMRVAVGADTLGPYVLRRNAPIELLKCL